MAAKGAYNGLLLGLGAVALLVGGVGIANVMVISVLERRSEIGLRRALGATRHHVAEQFLAEALTPLCPGRSRPAPSSAELPPPSTHSTSTGQYRSPPSLSTGGSAGPWLSAPSPGSTPQSARRPPLAHRSTTHRMKTRFDKRAESSGNEPEGVNGDCRRQDHETGPMDDVMGTTRHVIDSLMAFRRLLANKRPRFRAGDGCSLAEERDRREKGASAIRCHPESLPNGVGTSPSPPSTQFGRVFTCLYREGRRGIVREPEGIETPPPGKSWKARSKHREPDIRNVEVGGSSPLTSTTTKGQVRGLEWYPQKLA